MSRAIASARQRRAGITPTEPATVNPPKPAEPSGLTIHQVISLVDSRLVKLEKFMNESKENGERHVHFSQEPSPSSDEEGVVDISTILEDFNTRFVMLAEEISTLKDSLLKLQTYTMEVNRMLLEERVTPETVETTSMSYPDINSSTFVIGNPAEEEENKASTD
uniref:Uncharacterized protein n=1 Tax=viral metagenome TaxID=1070528 RepID=A0A6C0DWM7_9ZZZZ